MNINKISLFAAVSTLGLAIIACTINIGGPNYPTLAIPVSTEEVGELQSSMESIITGEGISEKMSLTISEPQFTSFLYYRLQSQTQPLITNPQVYLRDGQIQLYGTARKSYFVATARIILSAGVDDQGQLNIELTSADFGPLPVPEGLKEIITATIQEAYTGALGPVATGFRLESVVIADGIMIIVGQIK